jgi:hypothetical protein
MDDDQEHGPRECGVDNMMGYLVIFCACGFVAHGDTWGEAGDSMDIHLEGMNES